MSIRILHLEDDPVDAELVQARLTADGIDAEVVTITSREAFEAALRSGHIDLVLADFALPGYSGEAALAHAQQHAPDTPFIFVTGQMGEEAAIETLKRGATDYVYKNRLARLGPAVRRALDEAEMRQARRRAQAAAQSEREWLRVTLGSIGDAVIATDTLSRVTFMNSVAEALTGWSQSEAAGQPIVTVFNIIHEGSRQPVNSPVLHVIREGVIAGLENHTLLVTKDGRELPIDDSAAPIRDEQGTLMGVVLVFRDVTERRRAELALEAQARCQAVVAELGHLALAGRDLLRLMNEAAARVAAALGVELAKVLELQPDGGSLLICAGHGWPAGVVGQALVDASPNSQAGYTLQTNAPVITADLARETRFAGMPLLHQNGVVSGVSVVIPGPQQPFGVLSAHSTRPRQFSPDEANFLQAVANVLAEAIARQRVEDSLRGLTIRLDRALVEAELLNAIAAATSGEANLERLLSAALEHLTRAIPFTGGSIALVEGDDLVIHAAFGPFASIALGQRLHRGEGASWRVVDTGQAFLSNDLAASQLSATTPIQSYLAVPLFWRGRGIGLLEVDSTRPNAFNDSDLLLVQKAATLLSGSVELARQYAAEQRARAEAEAARQRLAFLAEASDGFSGLLEAEALFESLAALAVPRLADCCSIYALGSDGRLALAALNHVEAPKAATLRELAARPPDPANLAGLLGQVIRSSKPLLVPQWNTAALDTTADPAFQQFLAALAPRSMLAVPLVARGRTLGAVVLVFAESGRRYTGDDLELAGELGHRAAMAIDNAWLYARLEERVLERTAELQAANARLADANEKIRSSERLLAEAQQIAELGSWRWDIPANTISWSEELYHIYGLDPAEFIATFEGYLERLHPHDRPYVQATITRAYQDRQPFTFDHRIVRPDGSERTLHCRGEVAVDAAGQPTSMTGVALDITQRKQIEDELRASHEELRRLSSYIQAAREEERKRIAREIHDELGGSMTGLKMEVSRLNKLTADLTRDETAAGKLQERTGAMLSLIETTIKTVRRIATELRPAMLDDFGLLPAIEWQLQEFEKRSGIECVLDVHGEADSIELEPDGATAMFRVFQETLTNVARHAQATQVEVTLQAEAEHLILRVKDNGRGISQREMRGTTSLGLVGMRERVRLLAGELVITGAPGQGTMVLVRIPLNNKSANGDGAALEQALKRQA